MEVHFSEIRLDNDLDKMEYKSPIDQIRSECCTGSRRLHILRKSIRCGRVIVSLARDTHTICRCAMQTAFNVHSMSGRVRDPRKKEKQKKWRDFLLLSRWHHPIRMYLFHSLCRLLFSFRAAFRTNHRWRRNAYAPKPNGFRMHNVYV